MFFEDKFNALSPEDRENMFKTLFMMDDSDYASKVRQEYYKSKLRYMGKNVTFGPRVRIVNPQYISIGDNSSISEDTTLIARGPKGITIGNDVTICDRVYLDTEDPDDGYITIGNNVYIGTGTTLFGHCGYEIGDHCLLAQNITSTPYSHKYEDPDRVIIAQGGHSKKVTIGRDSYIGMGVCIMYSGSIGEGSVVGSGAVVVKPIPPYSVAVGNPAKVIKERKK